MTTLKTANKCLRTCAYNPSHRVGNGSFYTHLMNCRSKLSARMQADMMICEYNVTHHVRRLCYKAHLVVCPDKEKYDVEHAGVTPDVCRHPDRLDREMLAEEEKAAAARRQKAAEDEEENIDPRILKQKEKEELDAWLNDLEQ